MSRPSVSVPAEWEELTEARPGFGAKGDLWVADCRDAWGSGDLMTGILMAASTSVRATKRYVEEVFADEPGVKRWRRNGNDWVYEVRCG